MFIEGIRLFKAFSHILSHLHLINEIYKVILEMENQWKNIPSSKIWYEVKVSPACLGPELRQNQIQGNVKWQQWCSLYVYVYIYMKRRRNLNMPCIDQLLQTLRL